MYKLSVCVCVLRIKFLDSACTFLVNLTYVVIFMTIPMSANKMNLKIWAFSEHYNLPSRQAQNF